MRTLTYSDRARLLQELEQLGQDQRVGSDELNSRAFSVLQAAELGAGFAEPLVRNVSRLSAFLDQGEEEACLARGAIRYVLRSVEDVDRETPGELAVQIGLQVTDLALSKLTDSETHSSGYLPWSASAEERRKAEDMFLGFVDRPFLPDADLLHHSLDLRSQLSSLEGAGIIGRLVRNIEYLTSTLTSGEAGGEQLSWCRAALSYLVRKDDVVQDDLGFIGLLDDALVLDLAAQLVEPEREPWQDLLDSLFRNWPFLQRLVFNDDRGIQAPSEFLLINAAMLCDDLRGENVGKTALVLPDVGNLPIVLSFFRTLGSIQDWLASSASPKSLSAGDTVCIDNTYYAEFVHSETLDDPIIGREKGMWLQYWPRRDQSRRYWLPLSELPRLVRVPHRDYPRGPVPSRRNDSESKISAVEHLFSCDYPSALHELGLQTLLVTDPFKARRYASMAEVWGHKLLDAVPLGHLDREGSWKLWSRRFACDQPVIGVVSDLYSARSILECGESEREAPIVVLDFGGCRSRQISSIEELEDLSADIFCVATPRDSNGLDLLHRQGFKFWEWGPRAAKQVLWGLDAPGNSQGPVALLEAAVRRGLLFQPTIEDLSLPATLDIQGHLSTLGRLLQARGEEVPPELDEAYTIARLAFFGIMRQLTPTDSLDSDPQQRTLVDLLAELGELENTSLFLKTEELAALAQVRDSLSSPFLDEVCSLQTPKCRRLNELLQSESLARVVVANSHQKKSVSRWLAENNIEVKVESISGKTEYQSGTTVVAGWFNRQRTPALLVPPIADHVILLFYEVESQWFRAWNHGQAEARKRRRLLEARPEIFPKVRGWSSSMEDRSADARRAQTSPAPEVESSVELDWHEMDLRRERALRSAIQSDAGQTCEALLFWFADGHHVFLSPGKHVIRVTDVVNENDEGRVHEIRAIEIEEGDHVLLHESAEGDALRELADSFLPDGVRETSRLWREALVSFKKRNSLDIAQLSSMLAGSGCRRHPQTIKNWLENDHLIGPRSETDIDQIASLTGDQQLSACLAKCKDAVDMVRSAHIRAGTVLAGRVAAHIQDRLSKGQGIEQIERSLGHVSLVQVEAADTELIQVPVGVLNRILGGDRPGHSSTHQ